MFHVKQGNRPAGHYGYGLEVNTLYLAHTVWSCTSHEAFALVSEANNLWIYEIRSRQAQRLLRPDCGILSCLVGLIRT